MKVIGFIENEDAIKKILKHLNLWDVKARTPSKNEGSPKPIKYIFYNCTYQLPASDS